MEWISEECYPEGFTWADPSKIRLGQVFELLEHWRERKKGGLTPLIWNPSCTHFKGLRDSGIINNQKKKGHPSSSEDDSSSSSERESLLSSGHGMQVDSDGEDFASELRNISDHEVEYDTPPSPSPSPHPGRNAPGISDSDEPGDKEPLPDQEPAQHSGVPCVDTIYYPLLTVFT
jgi:hypothetical protein